MKKITALLLLSLLPALYAPAAKSGVVKVVKASLLSRPDFLSATMATLRQGERVEIIGRQNSWDEVRTPSGIKGFLHSSALQESKSSLSGLLPGERQASDDEVALAAKGFNETNEKKIRGSQGFNFRDLDWILGQSASLADVKKFVSQGKLK